jgi:hypothetical protein
VSHIGLSCGFKPIGFPSGVRILVPVVFPTSFHRLELWFQTDRFPLWGRKTGFYRFAYRFLQAWVVVSNR